jgi:hypothetical protein
MKKTEIMAQKDMEELEKEITRLEDIQAIEDLQQKYGYYMDTHNRDEVFDLFSDQTESIEIESTGLFIGKEGVRKFYLDNDLLEKGQTKTPGWINILIMMHMDVINIDPSGNTAKGRWNTWLAEAMMVGGIPRQQWVQGYYENEYIKEDGVWRFKKLNWNVTFFTSFDTGWLKIPLLGRLDRPDADAPAPNFHPYPSGFRLPYSFPHPVTVKPTSEA